MAQNQELRSRTTAPTAPSAGVFQIYTNASGALISQNSAGRLIQIGGQWTGTYAEGLIVTGAGGYLQTGTYFGEVPGNSQATGLASPTRWIPFLGPNNENLAIPAYRLR